MSKIEVNEIDKQNGSTVTIGGSGTNVVLGTSGQTVSLGTGASQTGFGRTGTVDWQTTVKTGDFTAANGEGYFVNTTSGGVTMTLPSSPSAGNIVSVKDYAYKFGTNALTVNRNGSPIGGGSGFNPEFTTNGAFLTFIYADAVKGWLLTDDSNNTTDATSTFIAATGGTITTVCTNFKVHTFTGPGTFEVTSCAAGPVAKVSYLVLAGGGGGGSRQHGAGAGAGGFRESKGPSCSYTASPTASTEGLQMSKGSFPITVGGGGAGGPTSSPGNNPGSKGANSVFSSIISAGGGFGQSYTPGPTVPSIPADHDGGSGGGGGGTTTAAGPIAGGTGNTPPVSPSQGNNGGDGDTHNNNGAGGGGGAAGAVGSNANGSGTGGTGGAGLATSITASPVTRAGGGGGAHYCSPGSPGGASGGSGGGGAGTGAAGTTNTGSGGGAGGGCTCGGAGGSGIVIIRYKFQ